MERRKLLSPIKTSRKFPRKVMEKGRKMNMAANSQRQSAEGSLPSHISRGCAPVHGTLVCDAGQPARQTAQEGGSKQDRQGKRGPWAGRGRRNRGEEREGGAPKAQNPEEMCVVCTAVPHRSHASPAGPLWWRTPCCATTEVTLTVLGNAGRAMGRALTSFPSFPWDPRCGETPNVAEGTGGAPAVYARP